MTISSQYAMLYKRTLATAPERLPVAVADVKTWCYVVGDDHDDLLESLIRAATQKIEQDFDCAIIAQTWNFTTDAFPSNCWENEDSAIVPNIYPVISVSGITYVNTAGSTTTLASDKYLLEKPHAMPARILRAYGQDWPSTRDQHNAVTVSLSCGFGTEVTDVPKPIITAIKMMVKYWYDNPEDNFKKGDSWQRSARQLLENFFAWRI